MDPIISLVEFALKLVDGFRTLVREYPELATFIIKIGAIAGAALIAVGSLLKLSGSIFLLTSSLTQFSVLAGKGISITNVISRAFGLLGSKMLPLILMGAVLYKAWETNFLGIRDIVTTAVEEIGTTLGLLFDALFDNTLSEDSWIKAKDLGILPFIESILQLKYHFGLFIQGFEDGFSRIFELLSVADNTIEKLGIYKLFDLIGKFFALFTGEDADSVWEFFGQVAGAVASVGGIILLVTKVAGIFAKVIGVIVKVVTFIISVGKAIGGIATAIGAILSGPALLVGAAIGSFALILGIMWKFRDEIIQHWKDTFERWGREWNEMVESIKSTFSNLVDGLVNIFTSFFNWLDEHFGWIADGINSAIEGISNFWNTPEVPSDATVVDLWPNRNKDNPVGLSTGGYVKDQGLALLHPDEVVVNDDLTSKLRSFLNSVEQNNTGNGTNPNNQFGSSQNDNRVIFESGSVIIQVQNTNDSNLEAVAEKLMRIIARKQQLRNMAVRA